jgi:hypothetical protein
MDFTTIHLSTNVSDDGDGKDITDYILCVEGLNEKGQLVRRYLDLLCDDKATKTNDYYFTFHSWYYLFRQTSFFTGKSHIIAWSDGGPKHFKTRFFQYLLSHLSCRFSTRITHHLFAAYHGHSIADGHAARVKSALNRSFIASEQDRLAGKLNYGPRNARDTATVIQNDITSVHVFDSLSRLPIYKPTIHPIPDIKQYHCFDHNQGMLTLRKLSSDATGMQHVFKQK